MLKPTKYYLMAVTGVIEKEDKSVERSQFLELTKTGSGERVKEHYRSQEYKNITYTNRHT
jgi:hypothetical protein